MTSTPAHGSSDRWGRAKRVSRAALSCAAFPSLVLALFAPSVGPDALAWARELVGAFRELPVADQDKLIVLGLTVALWFRFAGRFHRALTWDRGTVSALRVSLQAGSPSANGARNVVDGDLSRKATHEAGHAVVADAIGLEVVDLDVIVDGAHGGQTRSLLAESLPPEEQGWQVLVSGIAGRVMDDLEGCRDARSSSDIGGCMEAMAVIVSVGRNPAWYTGPLTFDAMLAGARDHARTLLVERRAQVDAVATALLASPTGRLDRDAFLRAFGDNPTGALLP